MLDEAGINATICADLGELERALADDAGLVVITEEAVGSGDLRGVAAWLQAQPA